MPLCCGLRSEQACEGAPVGNGRVREEASTISASVRANLIFIGFLWFTAV